MGKNLPYATGLATALIAGKPHGYWRRDPESNRARRICNPPSTQGGQYATEGNGLCLGRLEGRKCLQLSKKLPDEHRPNRPGSGVIAHGGFGPSGYSNDHAFLAASPLWRGRSSSNDGSPIA
jgi:hypothetical protein